MKVIKIGGQEIFGEAKKVSVDEYLKYKLWVDENYELYVQIEDNDNTGSFTGRAFRVSDYVNKYRADAALKTTIGYDVKTGSSVKCTGNNDAGFLKAVLQHLLHKDEDG